MKLKELYNPTISGTSYEGFFKAVKEMTGINSTWLTKVNLEDLDNYIRLKVGEREVYSAFDSIELSTYKLISSILRANEYKLNGLYDSTTYDSQFNPIENYDRYEDTSVKQDVDNGAQQGQTQNAYTEYTDTDTSSNTNSILSVDDYGNKTDKNVTDMKHAAHTDTSTTTANAVHNDIDTVTESHIHGNIGIMDASTLLDKFRQGHLFIFYDYILTIVYDEILKGVLWED